MRLTFTDKAWEGYLYWSENDEDIIHKINELIAAIKKEPFTGIGKPEPLKGNLSGYWSRRITNEHRLVYFVEGKKPNQVLTILQVRFHY